MDGRVGVGSDDVVHEVEELDAPTALIVRGRHLAGGHLEGGEQRRGAVALVFVAMAGQRPAVRQLQIALRPLQRLDRGLLVDADDDRVLGRRQVEPDDSAALAANSGSLLSHQDLRPGKIDLLGAQEAPDILHIDVAERRRHQRTRPARIARGRRPIQQRQNALVRLRRVLRLRAAIAGLVETGKPLRGVAHPPFRGRSGRAADRRPIARLATPSAAISTIRARWRIRCSVLVERAKPSSSARSSSVS